MLRFFASLKMREGERFAMTVVCCYKRRSGIFRLDYLGIEEKSIKGRG